MYFFFFQAEDGIRDGHVTGVQTCALPILASTKVTITKPLIHSLSYWLINGFVIVTFVLAILSKSAGTPSEIALKYENKALAEHLRQTEESLTELERQLHYISKMDRDKIGRAPCQEV